MGKALLARNKALSIEGSESQGGTNPMKGFKSSESRLVRLFQKSREQWKQRAAEKQKKLRVMEIKVRDLSASREHWKARALVAQQQQRQLELELENLKKKVNYPSQKS